MAYDDAGKVKSFSETSLSKTLSSQVLARFSVFLAFGTQKSVSDCPICLILWTRGYWRPCGMYKLQKTENLTKTCEDKVLRNEVSEKDSALGGLFSSFD